MKASGRLLLAGCGEVATLLEYLDSIRLSCAGIIEISTRRT